MRVGVAVIALAACGGGSDVTVDAAPDALTACQVSMQAISGAGPTAMNTTVAGTWTFTGTYQFRSFEAKTAASFVYEFDAPVGPCVAGRLVSCGQQHCNGVPTGSWYSQSPHLAIRHDLHDNFGSVITWRLVENATGGFDANGSTHYDFHSPETIQFYAGALTR
jgi:hypothetical protein